MIGHLVSCYGAADRYLGMLAATLGESDGRRRTSARPWSSTGEGGDLPALTAYEYGRFLLARGAGDRDHADALLSEAASLAGRIGLPTLLGRIQTLGAPTPAAGLPDGLSPREVQILGLIARVLSNREIGRTLSISSTPPPTTSAASCARPAAPIAPRRPSYAHRHRLATI
jgi:hypothetical protein